MLGEEEYKFMMNYVHKNLNKMDFKLNLCPMNGPFIGRKLGFIYLINYLDNLRSN